MQYYKTLLPKRIEDAINSITPPLALYKRECGEQKLQALLVLILADVVNYFSTGKTMGQFQFVDTIRLITQDFYYFNLDDFRYCFDQAKRGYYGTVYDRIDGNVIYSWLTAYDQERINTAYQVTSPPQR